MSLRPRRRTIEEKNDAEDLRRRVFDRAGWACEARAALGSVCDTAPSGVLEAHHRLMRSQGGPDTEENLVAVCAGHHREIHANPARSYDLGLLIRSHLGPPTVRWEGIASNR